MFKKNIKVLFTTSTIPASNNDLVPAFVKDEAIWLKKTYPHLQIDVLAPHSAHAHAKNFTSNKYYNEYRFHYFWPNNLELLTGKGIQPALKNNRLLYFQLPGLFIAEFFATLKIVKKTKPDVIYAHWFTPQAITSAMVAKLTKTALVFDTQASDAIVLKNLPFSKKLVVSICKISDAITVPSQQTLDKLLYFTDPKSKDMVLKKVKMVSYGTSVPLVKQQDIANVKVKYSLNDKDIIYFIGRLVDRKGVDILIRAFQKVKKERENSILVIVGDGQMRYKLEMLAKKLSLSSSVIFTGFLNGNERYALLKAASICVIPSVNIGDQSEGLPVVFMEAVNYSKIVVLSDATGAHEVASSGRDCFVVSSGSVESLELGMLEALNQNDNDDSDFYDRIAELGEQFLWKEIVKKRYSALLQKYED